MAGDRALENPSRDGVANPKKKIVITKYFKNKADDVKKRKFYSRIGYNFCAFFCVFRDE